MTQTNDIENLGLSPEEAANFEAVLAYREREEVPADELLAEAAVVADGEAAARRISKEAYQLIVEFETGGKAYYERVIKSRPIWPKASSGITIGFGYDLGYVSLERFRSDWAALLQGLLAGDRTALEACIGFHSGKNSPEKMNQLLDSVKHIRVDWQPSEVVFRASTLPRFALMTQNAVPNTDLLNGDCFGVLVSLTFNRGASYSTAHNPQTDSKDRYREMRQIKSAMDQQHFADIPGLLRRMVRIWQGTDVETGLTRRREAEAQLFLSGLAVAESELAPFDPTADAQVFAAPLPENADSVPEATDSDENFWTEVSEDDFAEEAAEAAGMGVFAIGATWADDEVQPDYAHLGRNLLRNVPFTITVGDLELLARLNAFDLSAAGNTIVFGLRGCGIVKDHEAASEPVLMDQRPDHDTPRCVIGVWKRGTGTVAVFPGSTVPNQAAVALYRRDRSAGNLLGTGLHGYVCGPHITSRTTPGCLLLRKPDMSKRVVVVRRSIDDLSYQKTDKVHRCAPGDNIHPTFFSTPSGFSSLGCQTVVGTFKDGRHSGPWAKFRSAIGFTDNDGDPGRPFRYMLLTGAEARLASALRIDGLAGDPVSQRRLRRLRQGSSGPAVEMLQRQLGLANPDKELGPFTCEALHLFQEKLPNARGSDGIYTPAMDETLGWGVFSVIGV